MDANIYSILRLNHHGNDLSNTDATVLRYIFWQSANHILLKKKVKAIDEA